MFTVAESRLAKLFKFFTGIRKGELIGTEDPKSSFSGGLSYRRKYNLEVPYNILRDPEVYGPIAEMSQWCYEASESVRFAAQDVFANREGDDIGFRVSETLDDDETPVDAQVKAIADDLIERRNGRDFVIGGNRLKLAVEEFLQFGDEFIQFAIEREGIGRGMGDLGISKTMYLPPLEMFVLHSEQGELQGYEQREMLQDRTAVRWVDRDMYRIVHFSHRRKRLYGQSIFGRKSITAWEDLKDVNMDIKDALRSIGVVPNIHTMFDGATVANKDDYQQKYEEMTKQGIVTDLFLLPGAEVKKMEGVNSNLDSLINRQLDLRCQIIPAGFPVWMYPGMGLQMQGAREISQEPSRVYSRMRHSWCSTLAEGIRWMIDTELVLKMGFDEFEKRGKYRIIFPDFKEVSQGAEMAMPDDGESGDSSGGISDLDEDKKRKRLVVG